MVLAEWVRLCTVSLAEEGFVRLLVELADSLLGREACTWRLSWPCIGLGETTTTGTVVLISRKRYEGNLEAVCSLRASGGTSIALYGGLAWPEDGEGKQAGGLHGVLTGMECGSI